MLSLLIIALIAGTSYCEEPSEYSDCAKEQTIVDGCSSHLDYMRAKNPSEMSTMQRISDLKDPMALLEKVQFSNLCNETMHLKMYYNCVFTNLTTCLQAVNSTQMNSVPDAARISKGIEDMCNSRDELNKTCLLEKKMNVFECLTDIMKTKEVGTVDHCAQQEFLTSCTDELSSCAGHDVVKEYVVSARPHQCQDTSAAPRGLAALSLLLGSLLLHLGLSNSL